MMQLDNAMVKSSILLLDSDDHPFGLRHLSTPLDILLNKSLPPLSGPPTTEDDGRFP